MLVSLDDVYAARDRLAGVAVRTPLLSPSTPPARGPVLIKPESLQPTGAFKLRGAYNAVATIPADRRAAGVVTHSSGNHGRALAWAARAFGVPAVVVSPDNVPEVKIAGMRAVGAEVVLVPAAERHEAACRIAAERGAELVPPYDDPRVIAGQGTVGLEIAADLPEVSTVLVPIGGGGLIAGVSLVLAELAKTATVIGVEPELAADAADSFAAGRRVAWTDEQTAATAAEGVRVPVVGELTWAHIERYVHQVVTVTEDEITAAIGELARSYRVVAEPSGAVAPAAALYHATDLPAGPVVAVLSGGNAEPQVLADAVRSN
ncbi:MAG: pyridoxal-phosphate dependent enzyme [Streptosporangiales bacterium]|nr:pyridoxal-phosphate dependent enzyme [Streptosporangiales bacterium]